MVGIMAAKESASTQFRSKHICGNFFHNVDVQAFA